MGKKIGLECKLYVSSVLMTATPEDSGLDWLEVDKARDLDLNLEAGEADVTARDNSGWRATRATLREASIEFEASWDPDDEALEAIRDAFLDGSALAVAVMDGPLETVGSEGFAANCRVTGFSRSEPLEEGVVVKVTIKPEDLHQWYEVAA